MNAAKGTTAIRTAMALAALAIARSGAPASAAVVGVTVADASSGNYTLTSLSMTRGSAGNFTYLPSQLTGVDLTDVASVQLPLAVQRNTGLPAVGTRATLLEDGRLDTGVINPFSTGAAADASFEVTFRKPVINSTGDDLVILEIGSGDPTRFWINNDRTNQGYEVTTANFTPAVISGMPFTLYKYANGTDQNVDNLTELESATGFAFDKDDTGSVVGLGLDLSVFGVPLGSSVASLRFQSVGTARIDPVYIVGLPPVPAAGDANSDGVVNVDDYTLIDRGYARYLSGAIPAGNAGWRDGDFDRNGAVNSQDYLLIDSAWMAAYPATSPEFLSARATQFGDAYVAALISAVPEPAGLSLLGLGSLALAARPRRRGRA